MSSPSASEEETVATGLLDLALKSGDGNDVLRALNYASPWLTETKKNKVFTEWENSVKVGTSFVDYFINPFPAEHKT